MHNFDLLPSDARTFLSELQTNTSRDWFLANKARYDDSLKAPALALLAALSDRLSALSGAEISTKLFRAHRDVRFSKDKSPYNLHLHMLWAPQGAGTQPAYFFGIAQDYVTAGGGIMGFDKQQQADWRAFVAEREGAKLQAKIDAVLVRAFWTSVCQVCSGDAASAVDLGAGGTPMQWVW